MNFAVYMAVTFITFFYSSGSIFVSLNMLLYVLYASV